jgi:hypothetical protein
LKEEGEKAKNRIFKDQGFKPPSLSAGNEPISVGLQAGRL